MFSNRNDKNIDLFFQWIFGTQNPGAGEEEISEHKEQM